MKKRIFVGLILVLLLLPMSALHVLADAHYNMYDITQETSGIAPEGFTYPALFFDYEKGITEEEIKQISEVYLTAVRVFSQYAEEGVKNIENDTLIYPKYIKYGIPNNAPYQDPNYLNEQVYRGLTLKRGEENEFKPFTGEFYFSDDDRYKAGEGVSYHNYYSYCADVNFSISNVVFKDDGIYMDIDGEQSYYYAVTTRLEFYHDWEKEKPAFDSYKAKIEKSATAEETKRIISGKGVKLDYVLYDIEGTDDKNLFLKYENGGIKILFLVRGVIGNKSAGTPSAEVTQNAEENPGEDGGVGISTDIVDPDDDKGHSKSDKVKSTSSNESDSGVGGAIAVGVLSTGTAIGAAAAASGKGTSKGKSKKKSYKMYVQKDFGDAIRRGGTKPVKIRARMAEVGEDGISRDRNDLTALISVSGDGMTIHDAALVGRYCEATVSVPADNADDTANIIFTFNGEGGTFTNTVIFRLVDGPSIKFVEETEKPGEYILKSDVYSIDAIYGDKQTYTAQFMVVDATVMPEAKDITVDKINDFDIKFEETARQYVYKLIVINNTTSTPEKERSIFAKPTVTSFSFHVMVQGEEKPLEGYVYLCMHDEGITISSKEIKKEALWIDTLPVEYSGVSFSDIRPVLFDVLVCYIGKDGAVILNNPEVSFGDINDNGLYGNTFKENFRFKTSRLSDGTHGFFPIDTLPQACEPYEALLPITYQGEKKLEAEIPLRLGGEEPTPPSQEEWEKAYEKLKKDIEIFGVDANDPTTKYLLAHAHEHSAEELAFTRKWIIMAGMHFYAEQNRQYQKIDQTMTRYIIVANSFVKAGDYAVEVLLTIYWGKTAGKITANFVNPLKNMLANYIGQYIGPGSESGTDDYEKMPFFKTLLEGCQEALGEAMTGDLKPDPEKLGYIVATYLMVSFVKHYYEGEGKEKGDIYRSMVAAAGDLTLAKFKAWLSDKISKLSKPMWDKIGELFGKAMRTYFNSALKESIENAGNKAFESSIRSAVKSGGVDSLKYATAKLAKEGAQAMQEESAKILLKQYADSFGEQAANVSNKALALVLNYLIGGKNGDNETLGLSVEDVLQEFFFDRFGIYVNKVLEAAANPLDVGIKVNNGILFLEILGYVVEIPLEKNALVVIGMVFDFCFGWMEDLWNIATSNPSSLPDPRDTVTYASAKLEEGKEILENMPPITYHKKDKQ